MSGDYISREVALSEACKGCGIDFPCEPCEPQDCEIKARLEAIPAADVTPVRYGRWNRIDHDALNCNKCGATFIVIQGYEKMWHCPSCGAKMDDNAIQHTECVGNALGALDEVEELSRYIDANKMADELSKVPWYERKDEKQAVRMVKEFPAADVQEVRHGKWVESHKHVWQLDESGNIDMWVLDHGFHNGPRCVICHDTFCEHCTPDWETTECDAEHYECSKCGNISLTKTAYCPSCGAKMDGRKHE